MLHMQTVTFGKSLLLVSLSFLGVMRIECRVVSTVMVKATQSFPRIFLICFKIIYQERTGNYVVDGGGHVISPEPYLHQKLDLVCVF